MSTPFRGLWRHADFLKLWAGQATSMFGSLIGGFAYSLVAIITLHASPEQIALLNGCRLVPGMLAGPWIGVWADRLRRRPLLIAADLGRALVLASIPIAAVMHTLTMRYLYVVAMLVSVLTVLFDVSYRAYVPDLIGSESLVEGNSKLQSTEAIAEAGGFGISGLLVQVFTAPIAILFDSVSFLVSACSVATIRHREPHFRLSDQAGERRRSWPEIQEGIHAIRNDALLRALAATMFAAELVTNAVGVVIMLFFVRELRLTPMEMGPLFGIGGISAFAGALIAGRVVRRWGLGHGLIGSLYVTNLGLLAIVAATGPLPLVLILMAIAQCTDGGRTIYEIHSLSLVQSRAPHHLAGRINAGFEALRSAAMLVGLPVGAALGQIVGLRATLFLALIAGMLVPLCLVFSPIRTMREMRSAYPDRSAAVV